MNEIYPEKYANLKKMFYISLILAALQFFIIAYIAGEMEWMSTHIIDQHKRILNLENRLRLE